MKSVRIGSYSGPYFPAFGLNTERYSIYLRIQSEYGRIRTRLAPNTDPFYAVEVSDELHLFTGVQQRVIIAITHNPMAWLKDKAEQLKTLVTVPEETH